MSDDLNVRVARALGWPSTNDRNQTNDFYADGFKGCVVNGVAYTLRQPKPRFPMDHADYFEPATDWNDAMYAAEQVGKSFRIERLSETTYLRDCKSGHNPDAQENLGRSKIKDTPYRCRIGRFEWCYAPTGCECICLAILKLKEGETT